MMALPTPSTPAWITQAAGTIGVPAVLALVILLQLLPRIDHGIGVADRVEGKLDLVQQQHAVILQTCALSMPRGAPPPILPGSPGRPRTAHGGNAGPREPGSPIVALPRLWGSLQPHWRDGRSGG